MRRPVTALSGAWVEQINRDAARARARGPRRLVRPLVALWRRRRTERLLERALGYPVPLVERHACPVCHVGVLVPAHVAAERRATGAPFTCPLGHALAFTEPPTPSPTTRPA